MSSGQNHEARVYICPANPLLLPAQSHQERYFGSRYGGITIDRPPSRTKQAIQKNSLAEAKKLCHKFRGPVCVDEKRKGRHIDLLQKRPHWSVLKREEQYRTIDQGEHQSFDIAIPLPAKNRGFPETAEGVELFTERFQCLHCGRCCYTAGAGLYLEKGEMERIGAYLNWPLKKIKKLCRHDKELKTWVLKQPCPFYEEKSRKCKIYSVRPLTCTRYPLHPPLREMPHHLAVDAFCPAARKFVKETLSWWIICENNWARLLQRLELKK